MSINIISQTDQLLKQFGQEIERVEQWADRRDRRLEKRGLKGKAVRQEKGLEANDEYSA